MILVDLEKFMNHFHVCCGVGGGARGFNNSKARSGNLYVKGRCVGGIDVDQRKVRDFERLAGVPGTVLDLFTREQYIAFHDVEPPSGWQEATPADFQRAAHGQHPHVVFMSTPCKGFSGLLSERASKSSKYQALNGLTLRAVWLTLEAWKDDPVELIFFENVPRIATRGAWLLDQIVALYRAYGYVVNHEPRVHDCGELGNLAQHRDRYLMVARHAEKVPAFMYEPPKRTVRGVGEVLERLPMPLTGFGGPMHRVPSLQWQTWLRLALVEAGSDWRSLNRLRVVDGKLADYGLMPAREYYPNAYGVTGWDEASCTVTSNGRPGSGKFAVADPRIAGHPKSVQLGVREWSDKGPTVTGQMWPGQGPFSVADPRLDRVAFNHVYRVVRFDEATPAVAGSGGPGGGLAVADPRPNATTHNQLGVSEWSAPSGAVAGESYPTNGRYAVADPRPVNRDPARGGDGVLEWEEPSGTIIGVRAPGQGSFAVADPRYQSFGEHHGKMRVEGWDDPAHVITGSDRVGSGALSVADPRPAAFRNGRDQYVTAGHYGVVPWQAPSGAVTGSAGCDNGRWSVADPRELPALRQNVVAIIRAMDGTWHRPLTTLELAALQALFDLDDFAEFRLDGSSDAAWREGIGNAVPGDSAAAMGRVACEVLAAVWTGETFRLSDTPVWVKPLAIAVSVDSDREVRA